MRSRRGAGRSFAIAGAALAVALAVSREAPAGCLNDYAAARSLGRGVSLGSMLEAPQEGQWGVRLHAELFAKAKEAGFHTVRLPVRWSNHAGQRHPYPIDEGFFRRVDFAIDEALRHELNIVVDMHHYRQLEGMPLHEGEMRVEDAVVDERFVAMWSQIAERYRALPNDKLFFELYNEPHSRLEGPAWNALLRKALQAVRDTNPDRFVVIGPADHNRAAGLQQLSLPLLDRRIIVSIHLYEPYAFTHQGAPWVPGSSGWLGTRCCSSEQRRVVQETLDRARQWGRRNLRPVWIGEFGSYEKADDDSRAAYSRMMREELEARGLPWAYWQLASDFGILRLDRGTWHTALKTALMGESVAGSAAAGSLNCVANGEDSAR